MINVVILAAGKGLRMSKHIKKQYIHIKGLPLLSHSLKTFDRCNFIDNIYLTVPKRDVKTCKINIVKPLKLAHHVSIISGGNSRQSSVFKSLEAINYRKGLVLIHDAARPLITKELILKCIEGVKETGACIPAISLNDSLKKMNVNSSSLTTINRKNIWLAQTPQAFNFNLIFNAHYLAKKNNITGTDDSFIAETAGETITMVEGDRYNFKVTTQQDLILAEAILNTSYKFNKRPKA